MNENHLFDDIARTLASPIPRREAFGRILRGLAGAALAYLSAPGTAWAKPKNCPPGQHSCGSVCCPKSWICCDPATGLCCHPGHTCEGKRCKQKPSQKSFLTTGI
jgi:hypothetical protein